MKAPVNIFLMMSVFAMLFACGKLQAQDSTMKHQWGIGSDLYYINDPLIEIHYKTFFHKKKFYNVSLISWLLNNRSTATYDQFDYLFIPSAEIGVSLPFLKYFRFNAAARTSFYFRRSKTDYTFTSEDGYYKRTGGFIGPNLGLELVPLKTGKCMVSLFGYVHVGYGYLHDKSLWYIGTKSYSYEQTEKNTLGIMVVGIAIRY